MKKIIKSRLKTPFSVFISFLVPKILGCESDATNIENQQFICKKHHNLHINQKPLILWINNLCFYNLFLPYYNDRKIRKNQYFSILKTKIVSQRKWLLYIVYCILYIVYCIVN